MYRLFSRPVVRPLVVRRASRSRPLGLERLETRDCPAAPVLTMHLQALASNQIAVTGHVQDENALATTVHLSGVVQAQVRPDANGAFSIVTTPNGSGPVSGLAVDDEGLWSEAAYGSVGGSVGPMTQGTGGPDGNGGAGQSPSPFGPYVVFDYYSGPNRTVVIDGGVVDDNPVGLTVTFSGVVEGSVVTAADGSFHITLTASALGFFHATTVDHDGLGSNIFELELENMKPTITEFDAVNQTGTWVISGHVDDDWAPGLTVTLSSSIPQVHGQTVTVASNGDFDFSFDTPAKFRGGTVSAVVTDWWGMKSDEVFTVI